MLLFVTFGRFCAAFAAWLAAYKRAWENLDTAASVALFSEDALYSILPFSTPLVGHNALAAYWSKVAVTQSDVHFDYDILAVTAELGINHWSVSFIKRKTGKLVCLDGIFVVRLNVNGLCTEFREWWEGSQ